MAVTVTAALVVDADLQLGTWNPAPTGDAGWDNTSGDLAWVPDETYYKKVKLEITGDAGEVQHTCNWEVFDQSVYWVDTAANIEAAIDGTAAAGKVLGLASDTLDVYAFNGTDDWINVGTALGDANGSAVATVRANGVRTVIDLPVYYKWDTADTEEGSFFVAAFLPGSFGTPSGTATLAISNPNEVHIGSETGAPQPRVAGVMSEPDPEPEPEPAPKKRRRKKKTEDA